MARDDILRAAGGFLLALALLPALWPGYASAGAVCPATEDVQLTVGQTKDAGDVEVCNNATTLTITYKATYPFCLLETDLHVATSVGDIPQNRQGSPTPDQFAYGDEYDPCVGTDTFEIPLDEIGEEGVIPGESVVIAAHAKLEDEDGKVEEAWGQGTRFVPRGNWAMYFTYTVEEPPALLIVFLTSTSSTGDLGGLSGADAICNNLAANAGLPGTYLAWLSTTSASPATRFARGERPYVRIDGELVATGWQDLIDGTIEHPINRTETGVIIPRAVWTGTRTNGTSAGQVCNGWSSSTAGAAIGSSSRTDAGWTQLEDNIGCSNSFPHYCFQQP